MQILDEPRGRRRGLFQGVQQLVSLSRRNLSFFKKRHHSLLLAGNVRLMPEFREEDIGESFHRRTGLRPSGRIRARLIESHRRLGNSDLSVRGWSKILSHTLQGRI